MTERIVGALEPSLRRAEINRARNKRPDSLDAYDQFLRAMPHAYANTAAGREEALRILADVLRLDPNYAAAHAFKAWCHEQRYFRSGFHSEDKAGALEHAALAMTLGADDPQALSIGAFVRAIVAKEHEAAIAALDRSLDMNGNSALAYGFSAQVHVQFGNYDRAIQHAERAVRLSPFDPFNYNAYMAQAFSYFLTDRFAEGINFGKLAVQSNPTLSPCHAMLIADLVMADRLDEARHSAERMLEVDPAATAEGFVRAAWARPDLMERFGSALRKAGVPA
jgi:tetratricopeptide (TPR) repeat protein